MENIQSFRVKDHSAEKIYKLMISTIIPRPIAFVSTINNQGITNLAPYSFFNGISGSPATLMISVARKGMGEKKDTQINIEETKQFVVNNVSESIWSPMVDSAANYPYGVSEFSKIGLTEEKSVIVKPPRVKESSASFECSLYKLVDIEEEGFVTSTVIIGLIEVIHIADNLFGDDGRIDPTRVKPVGRLGGFSYTKLGEVINKPVPMVK